MFRPEILFGNDRGYYQKFLSRCLKCLKENPDRASQEILDLLFTFSKLLEKDDRFESKCKMDLLRCRLLPSLLEESEFNFFPPVECTNDPEDPLPFRTFFRYVLPFFEYFRKHGKDLRFRGIVVSSKQEDTTAIEQFRAELSGIKNVFIEFDGIQSLLNAFNAGLFNISSVRFDVQISKVDQNSYYTALVTALNRDIIPINKLTLPSNYFSTFMSSLYWSYANLQDVGHLKVRTQLNNVRLTIVDTLF